MFMDSIADKALKRLFENINFYYDQERSFRVDKLDKCISDIIKLENKKYYKKFDIYNIRYLIEDIKYSVNLNLSDMSKRLYNQILKVIDNILDSTDTELFVGYLKDLRKLVDNYKLVIDKDIADRKKIITSSNDELGTIFLDVTKDTNIEVNTDKLTQLYTKTLKKPDSDKHIIEYETYFNTLKTFVKQIQSTDSFLPLRKNPILSLINLAYIIKNGIFKVDTYLASDIILLKAYYSANSDITKLNIINERINTDTLSTSLTSLQETQPSDELKKIIDFIDLQIFGISRYFNDFNLENIFFHKTHTTNTPKLESFEQLLITLKCIPDTIFDDEALYKKVHKERELYENLFTNNNDKPIEKIIEQSPNNLITKISNKYFQALLEIATSINIAISDENLEVIGPFIEFEKNFNLITSQISKKHAFNHERFYKDIKHLNKIYPRLKSNYSLLKDIEQQLIKNKNGISRLNCFFSKKKFLTYREIRVYNPSNKGINIDKYLTKINKNISNANYENASEKAKELTLFLLNQACYKCPSLIGIYNLPPFSNDYFLTLKEITDDPIINDLKSKQDAYWRI